MVQIRRRQATGEFGFLNEMTFGRHVINIMVVLAVMLCYVSYLILLRQEVRAPRRNYGASPKNKLQLKLKY